MGRYWKIASVYLKASLQAQMQYRGDMILGLCTSLLGLISSLIVMEAILVRTEGFAGGWTFPEMIVLVGVTHAAIAIMDLWIYPNLTPVPDYVREGDMDGILLRPIDPLFAVSFRHISSLGDLLGIGLGLVAIIYGMVLADQWTLLHMILFILMFFSGLVVTYSIWAGMVTLAFYFSKLEEFAGIFYLIERVGTFPINALPAGAKFLFTFIIPVAFVTNIPAEAAFGKLDIETGLLAIGVAVAALMLCRLAWALALKSYTSASS